MPVIRIRNQLPTALLLTALLSLVAATPAEAAFPSANGKIAFVSNRDGNPEIYVMNANGTRQTRRTNNPALDVRPPGPPARTPTLMECRAWSTTARWRPTRAQLDANGYGNMCDADINNSVSSRSPTSASSARCSAFRPGGMPTPPPPT